MSRRPQRDMQHRAVLSHVDVLAVEHGLNLLLQLRLLRQLVQQLRQSILRSGKCRKKTRLPSATKPLDSGPARTSRVAEVTRWREKSARTLLCSWNSASLRPLSRSRSRRCLQGRNHDYVSRWQVDRADCIKTSMKYQERSRSSTHVRSISVTWSSSAFHSFVVCICVSDSSISCICCHETATG